MYFSKVSKKLSDDAYPDKLYPAKRRAAESPQFGTDPAETPEHDPENNICLTPHHLNLTDRAIIIGCIYQSSGQLSPAHCGSLFA